MHFFFKSILKKRFSKTNKNHGLKVGWKNWTKRCKDALLNISFFLNSDKRIFTKKFIDLFSSSSQSWQYILIIKNIYEVKKSIISYIKFIVFKFYRWLFLKHKSYWLLQFCFPILIYFSFSEFGKLLIIN